MGLRGSGTVEVADLSYRYQRRSQVVPEIRVPVARKQTFGIVPKIGCARVRRTLSHLVQAVAGVGTLTAVCHVLPAHRTLSLWSAQECHGGRTAYRET